MTTSRFTYIAVAALTLAMACVASAAEVDQQHRPLMTAPACDQPPAVDGSLDDAAWGRASAVPMIAEPERLHNVVYACRDADAVYLGGKFPEPFIDEMRAPEAERDDGVYGHESVEVFLAPDDGSGQYYHLVVSAANVQRDEWCPAPGMYDASWNGEWESAVQIGADGWSIEIRIPFATLDVRPGDGEVWGLNLTRNRVSEDPARGERYSWSSLIGEAAFHRPDRFGRLAFTDAACLVQTVGDLFPGRQETVVSLRGPTSGTLEVSAGDKGELQVRAQEEIAGNASARWTRKVSDEACVVRVTADGVTAYSSGLIGLEDMMESTLAQLVRRTDSSGRVLRRLRATLQQLGRSDKPYEERIAQYKSAIEQVRSDAAAIISERLLENGPLGVDGEPEYGIAVASSMQKIMPQRPMRALMQYRADVSMKAARNEMEAQQVVLHCPYRDLHRVRLEATPLRSDNGAVIETSAITAAPVGFVHTVKPPYPVSVTGWWPDPILTDLDEFEVAQGDMQPIWYSVRVPADAAPGVYHGELTIRPAAARAAVIPVTVEVWDFTLPEMASLRTALSHSVAGAYNFEEPSEERMAELQEKFDRFIVEHRMNPGSIYRGSPPDEETLARWAELGITDFNIMQIRRPNLDPETHQMKDDFRRRADDYIEQTLETAEKYGIADRAYVYMFDEVQMDWADAVNGVAAWVEEQFPGLFTLTTAKDTTYGTDSPLTAMKGFCPLTPSYDREMADRARAEGREVWWYVCCGPHKPYANLFVDYPGVDPRLLMGFMSTAYRPDGFLYYSTIRATHNNQHLTGGPYTDWDPRSYKTYNGDGHIMYPGPDGPISSIRLENMLDGMEDYEYFVLLEELAAEHAHDSDLGREIQQVLHRYGMPGNELVTDMTQYTRDARAIEAARERIAELIVAAGVE